MGLMQRMHVYFASRFWESRLSLPFYWPFQVYFADIDSVLQDGAAFLRHKVLRKGLVVRPLVASVNVMNTFICNARCSFCTYRYNTIEYRTPFMSLETFRKAIDETIAQGFTEVNLTPTVGETLIDKGFFEKVAYAKQRNLKVILHTNGFLLDTNENYRKLVESGIDVLNISLCDLDWRIESRVYKVPEELAKSKVEGIRKLLALNGREKRIKSLALAFRQDRHPHKVTQGSVFRELQGKYHFDYLFFFRIDNWGGAVQQQNLSPAMRLRRERKFKIAPCVWLENLCIHPDGLVRACGCRMIKHLDDDLVIGDLSKQSLKEIIANGNLERIRKGFTMGKYPEVCKHCSVYWTK